MDRSLNVALSCSLCLEGKMARHMIICILVHGLWPVVLLDGQELGRNMVGKLVTREFGEEACM